MSSEPPVPPFKHWSQRRSDTSREWVEQLNRAFELLHEMPVPPLQLSAEQEAIVGDWAKHLRTTDPAAYWSRKLQESVQGSGEPTIPSVPWEPSPIDELFLKTCGIKPE